MKILIKWSNVGNWFCAMGGLLIGLGVSPLVFHLSDKSGVPTVVGAALGAGITVLGALWVNKSREIRERKAIREAAVRAIRILDAPTQRIESSYARFQILVDEGKHGAQLDEEVRELTGALFGLESCACVVVKQLESLTTVYHSCGPTVAVAHFHMTASIDSIRLCSGNAAKQLRNNLPGSVLDVIESDVSTIREFYKDINEDICQI